MQKQITRPAVHVQGKPVAKAHTPSKPDPRRVGTPVLKPGQGSEMDRLFGMWDTL